jgi:hypothetical protein
MTQGQYVVRRKLNILELGEALGKIIVFQCRDDKTGNGRGHLKVVQLMGDYA